MEIVWECGDCVKGYRDCEVCGGCVKVGGYCVEVCGDSVEGGGNCVEVC